MKDDPLKNQYGFTLIEVIITLMVSAILMVMIVPYLNSSITQMSVPIERLQTNLTIYQAMENISADYERRLIADEADLLASLKTDIGAESTTQSNSYGNYKVVKNDYIIFVSETEAAGTVGSANNALKVTLSHSTHDGLTATTLFTD